MDKGKHSLCNLQFVVLDSGHKLIFWYQAIPNLLAITPDQYASLKDQAHRLRNARLEENRKAGLQVRLDPPYKTS